MNSLLNAEQTFIERPVDGKLYKFNLLSMHDRAALSREALARLQADHDAAKTKLIENAKLAGLAGAEMYEALSTHDLNRPRDFDEEAWFRYVEDTLNAPAILTRSLTKHHPDEAQTVATSATLTTRDMLLIAGFELKPEEKKPDDKGADANPQAPLTYPTPAA